MRWQDIENDREKYAAYLCSREWSELKERVHKRSRGQCERSLKHKTWSGRCPLPGNAVHHLTYERKYRESLGDLVHYCDACHDFTHAKSDFDTLQHVDWCRYVMACDRPPVNDVMAFFGGRSEEWLYDLLGKYPHAYSMLVLHDAIHSFGREHEIPIAFNEDGEVVTKAFEASAVMEGTIDWIEKASGIPFEFAAWLRFGSPTINWDLYDESIKQIKKCVSKASRPRKRGRK